MRRIFQRFWNTRQSKCDVLIECDDFSVQDAAMAVAIREKAVKAREKSVRAREKALEANVAKHVAEIAVNKKSINMREAECTALQEAAKEAALAAAIGWRQLDAIVLDKDKRIAILENKLKSISLLLEPLTPPWQGYALMTTRPLTNSLFDDD